MTYPGRDPLKPILRCSQCASTALRYLGPISAGAFMYNLYQCLRCVTTLRFNMDGKPFEFPRHDVTEAGEVAGGARAHIESPERVSA